MTAIPQTTENTPPRHTAELTVALAGNPNVGKTTLFNALTGLKQKVANYPGVTVEKKSGRCLLKGSKTAEATDEDHGQWCTVIDLPGTYSLASRSPDEHVAKQVVLGQIAGTPQPDVICVVVDASNLERNLYLLTQVMELGRPAVVALSMCDIALKQGRAVNAEKLSQHLRLPVIPVQAHKGIGVEQLKKAIHSIAGKSVDRLELPLPEIMETHVERIQRILHEEKLATADQAEWDAHTMLTTGDDDDVPDTRRDHPRVRAALSTAIDELTQHDIDPIAAEIEAHYSYIGSIVHDCIIADAATSQGDQHRTTATATDRIDRVLTHKFWGMAIFVAIMGLVFVSIFSWAQPIMDFLQNTVIGGLGKWLEATMAEGPLKDLLIHGIITGVGNVAVFLPQIALLFLFLAILEDSGYMSRAAFLMDRLMSKVGLHGKSFIPLLSGYACAVPAILGTRVIENRRDRLATILILPLMSCSARLPVYSLMIGMFFTGALLQGGVMLAMYALGTLSAFAMAFLFKRTLLRGPAPAFILEMPPYRLPHWKTILTTVAQRSWQFLKRAGTVIFALSILMWAGTHYPKPAHFSRNYDTSLVELQKAQEHLKGNLPDALEMLNNRDLQTRYKEGLRSINSLQSQIDDLKNAQGQEILENSIAGRAGKFIEPAFYPLGFDWKLSVGVTGAFFAREVMISTMGIVYSVGEVDPDAPDALKQAMVKDTWPAGTSRAGEPIYTKLVAISVMVFFVFCMQCLSTLAVARKEMGHIGWPIFMFAYMTTMAWLAAFAVYQGGRLLGLG
jgi:ferrous iron transport protein B